jgi:SAM-dependent methyltransferase
MFEMTPTAAASVCSVRSGEACEFETPEPHPDRSGLVGPTSIKRCLHCGMGVTDPPLSDVAFLYEGRESQDFQPLSTGLARRIKSLAFTREARRILRQIGRTPKRVLDFGCGSGLFTRCMGDLLPAQAVMGSDFHPEPPAELEGRPYLSNEQLSHDPGGFDLIMAMHVIEHDDDPVRVLRRLKSLGSNGSTFVFEVPNIDCVWAPVFGKAWDAWYVPFHRVHFSRASLRGTLNRAGFEVVQEIDVSIPSMGRSIANLFGLRNTLPLLLIGAALHPIQWSAEKISRRPSALRVIARAAD